MTTFERALKLVLENEGGDVSAERAAEIGDPGGETSRGITLRTLRSLQATYPGTFSIAGVERPLELFGGVKRPADLTDEQVAEVYRLLFWPTAQQFESAAPGLAISVMDAAVQHGPRRAVQFLQRALYVREDGIAGVETHEALEQYLRVHGMLPLLSRYSSVRAGFLRSWVKLDARRRVMERGLLARVDRAQAAAEE